MDASILLLGVPCLRCTFFHVLEQLVRVGTVGNAVARLFRARDAFEVGRAECRRDPQLFLRTWERGVGLDYGVLTDDPDNEKSVFDVTAIYGGSS